MSSGGDKAGVPAASGISPELGSWFVCNYATLVRFATVVGGNASNAEDLVQEAFVRAGAAGARVGDATGIYVRRTIVNLSRSRFRRQVVEERALPRLAIPEEAPIAPPRNEEVWLALAGLSSRQRAVLALRYYEDLSEAQIATTLGISTGNVKKHAARGLKRLRGLLSPEEE